MAESITNWSSCTQQNSRRRQLTSGRSSQALKKLKTLQKAAACMGSLSPAQPVFSCRGRSHPGCCILAGTACTGRAWRTASAGADVRLQSHVKKLLSRWDDKKDSLHPGSQTSSSPEEHWSAKKICFYLVLSVRMKESLVYYCWVTFPTIIVL